MSWLNREGKKGVQDEFPLDDAPTYALFQRGETVGVFQYESAGMQKYLRDLKPNVFEDLIAMNALSRPGPLEYIPSFVRRKNGQEEIAYDLPAMEQYLKQTYGITVYQEQVMQLSQALARLVVLMKRATDRKSKWELVYFIYVSVGINMVRICCLYSCSRLKAIFVIEKHTANPWFVAYSCVHV